MVELANDAIDSFLTAPFHVQLLHTQHHPFSHALTMGNMKNYPLHVQVAILTIIESGIETHVEATVWRNDFRSYKTYYIYSWPAVDKASQGVQHLISNCLIY